MRRSLTARGAYTLGLSEGGLRVESWLGPPQSVRPQAYFKHANKHFKELASFVEWYAELAKRDHDAYLALQVLYAAIDSLEVPYGRSPLNELRRARTNEVYGIARAYELALQDAVANAGPGASTGLVGQTGAVVKRARELAGEYGEQQDARGPKRRQHARTRELAAKICWVMQHSGDESGQLGRLRWAGKARASAVWPGFEPKWRLPVPKSKMRPLVIGLGHRIFELASETLADCRTRDLPRAKAMAVARKLLEANPIAPAVAATWLAGEMGLYDWEGGTTREAVASAQSLAKAVFAREPRGLSRPPAGAGHP